MEYKLWSPTGADVKLLSSAPEIDMQVDDDIALMKEHVTDANNCSIKVWVEEIDGGWGLEYYVSDLKFAVIGSKQETFGPAEFTLENLYNEKWAAYKQAVYLGLPEKILNDLRRHMLQARWILIAQIERNKHS